MIGVDSTRATNSCSGGLISETDSTRSSETDHSRVERGSSDDATVERPIFPSHLQNDEPWLTQRSVRSAKCHRASTLGPAASHYLRLTANLVALRVRVNAARKVVWNMIELSLALHASYRTVEVAPQPSCSLVAILRELEIVVKIGVVRVLWLHRLGLVDSTSVGDRLVQEAVRNPVKIYLLRGIHNREMTDSLELLQMELSMRLSGAGCIVGDLRSRNVDDRIIDALKNEQRPGKWLPMAELHHVVPSGEGEALRPIGAHVLYTRRVQGLHRDRLAALQAVVHAKSFDSIIGQPV